MSAFENLKTTAKVASQVVKGRALIDSLIPGKRNHVVCQVIGVDGRVKQTVEGWNSRVDAGAAWQAGLMGSGAGTPAIYMALAPSTITVTKTDTALTGELSTNGFARALGTYAYGGAPGALGGSVSYTISKTFTATGAQTINAVALFNASSAGTMFVEANLASAATLATSDTLSVVYTVNI
jgi:hypothetical protein